MGCANTNTLLARTQFMSWCNSFVFDDGFLLFSTSTNRHDWATFFPTCSPVIFFASFSYISSLYRHSVLHYPMNRAKQWRLHPCLGFPAGVLCPCGSWLKSVFSLLVPYFRPQLSRMTSLSVQTDSWSDMALKVAMRCVFAHLRFISKSVKICRRNCYPTRNS